MIVDVEGVYGVAVSAGSGLDADVPALVRSKAVQDFVVEVDEGVEELSASPGVARVVFCGESAFCKVDAGWQMVLRGSWVTGLERDFANCCLLT